MSRQFHVPTTWLRKRAREEQEVHDEQQQQQLKKHPKLKNSHFSLFFTPGP